MRNSRLILSVAVIWGLTISCNNEIDLYPEDTPQMLFVMGCLDGAGNLQQVKIRKLIAGNEDASLMINDPVHYLPDNSIRVYLEESSGNQHVFSRVTHPPQTGGVFSQDSNVIYELKDFRPDPFRNYTLKIEDPPNGKELSAKIQTMPPASFTYPEQSSVDRVKYNLTDSGRPFQVNYSIAPASVLTISIKYADIMPNGDTVFRKARHTMPPVYLPHVQLAHELGFDAGVQVFTLNNWWQIFNRTIPDDPDVDYRQLYRFDFTVWTGDSTLARYYDYADRFDDNRKQAFNNIEGGLGLFFATSHSILKNLCPYEKFNKYLSLNDTTAHLRFSQFPFTGNYIDPDSSLFNPFFFTMR